MGKESRVNPQSQVREEIGSFNVKVILTFLDGTHEEIHVKKWIHQGDSLAISITDTHFRLVNVKALRFFEITPQEEVH